MTIKHTHISKGFLLAGLANLTVLVFSRFFTNTTIPEFDPVVMSNFGMLMIIVWGVTYMSIAKSYQHVKWLVGVFAIEKFIYGAAWINWMLNNSLSAVYEKDLMAGLFYSIYGPNDWLFFLFFSFVFIRLTQDKNTP
jgi:hypothetical protein